MLVLKVIYERFINCSYNNVAKGIHLLDKKHFLFIQEKIMQVSAFQRYIPLSIKIKGICIALLNHFVFTHLIGEPSGSLVECLIQFEGCWLFLLFLLIW